MKPSVLFISTAFTGHLNKTTLLAKYYAQKGSEITYLVHSEHSVFKLDVEFNCIHTTFFPVGIPRKKIAEDLNHQPVEFDADEAFISRRNVLIEVLEKVKPTLIFLDCFCTNDYLLVYDKLKDIRTIVLEPWLPNMPGEGVPPLHSTRFPHKLARLEWVWQSIKLWTEIRYDYHFDSQINVLWLIRKMKKEGLELPAFQLNADKKPVFPQLEQWHMYPKELDFFERKLPENVRYMGSVVDVHRNQPMASAVEHFLKIVSNSTGKILIYCTFGTVISTFVSKSTLLRFYENLNHIAENHPEWHILISVSRNVLPHLRPSGMNIMFATMVPQLEILKRATVCINHGGGGTVLECVSAGVPQLCVPAARKVDYCGNSARVSYHKLGLSTNFDVTSEMIESKIHKLVHDSQYADNARRFSEMIKATYGPDYLEHMNLPTA